MTVPGIAELNDRRLEDLSNVQRELTVSRVMTPREEFVCCVAGETTQAVMKRTPDVYDVVPVLYGNDRKDKSAPVMGLLHRDQVPFRNSATKVGLCMSPISTIDAIPVDRNLIVHICGMNGAAVELIRQGDKIVGLVTPSDLERLPVRIALFALIIDVEQAIGELVTARFPDCSSWLDIVSEASKSALIGGLKRANENGSVGQAILSVDFRVKLDLLVRCFDKTEHEEWVTRERDEIREMRNLVAHGAPFRNVKALPGQVKNLIRLRRLVLDQKISAMTSDS